MDSEEEEEVYEEESDYDSELTDSEYVTDEEDESSANTVIDQPGTNKTPIKLNTPPTEEKTPANTAAKPTEVTHFVQTQELEGAVALGDQAVVKPSTEPRTNTEVKEQCLHELTLLNVSRKLEFDEDKQGNGEETKQDGTEQKVEVKQVRVHGEN